LLRVLLFVFTSPRFSEGDYDRIYTAVRRPVDLDRSFETAKVAEFTRLAAADRATALAPMISKRRSERSPILDVRPSRSLPPLER
jgi:hypothetical protein